MLGQIHAPGKGKCWKCFQVEKWKRPCRRCGAKLCSKCVPSGKPMEICLMCRNLNIQPQGQQILPRPIAAMPPSSYQAVVSPQGHKQFVQSAGPPVISSHPPWQGGHHAPAANSVPVGGQRLAMGQHMGVSQAATLAPAVQMVIGQPVNSHHELPPPSQTVHPSAPYQYIPPQPVGFMGQTPGQSMAYQQAPGGAQIRYQPPGATQSTLVMNANQHHMGGESQSVMGSTLVEVETTVTVPNMNAREPQSGGLHAGKSSSTETKRADVKLPQEMQSNRRTGGAAPDPGGKSVWEAKESASEASGTCTHQSYNGTEQGYGAIHHTSTQAENKAQVKPSDRQAEGAGTSNLEHFEKPLGDSGGRASSHLNEAAVPQETHPPYAYQLSHPDPPLSTEVTDSGSAPQGYERMGNQGFEADNDVKYGFHRQHSAFPETSENRGAPSDERQGSVHPESGDQNNLNETTMAPRFRNVFQVGAEGTPPEPPTGYPTHPYSGVHPTPEVSGDSESQRQRPVPPPGYPTAVSGGVVSVLRPHTANRSVSARSHQVHVPSPSAPEEKFDPQWSPLTARLKALGKLPQSEPHQEAPPARSSMDSSRRSYSLSQPEVGSTEDSQSSLHRYASVPAPTPLCPDGRNSMEGLEDEVEYAGQSKVQERLRRIRKKDQFSRALLLLQGAGVEDFLEPLTIVLRRLGFSIDVLHSHSPLTRQQIVGRLEALTHGLIDGCQVFLCIFSEAEGGVELSNIDIRNKLLEPAKARVNVVVHVLIDGMRGMNMKYELKKYRSVRGAELIGWWEDVQTPPHQRIMKKQQRVTARSSVIQICAHRAICGYIPGSLICAFIDVLNKKKYLSYTSLFDELEVAIGEATQIMENYTPSLAEQPSRNLTRSTYTREPIALAVAGIVLPMVGSLAKPIIAHFLHNNSKEVKSEKNDARWRGGIVFSSLDWMDGDEMAKFDWCE
ncbi:hypothetical protein BSKO_07124 [Bryopsis sp. KO-2023]|nr:hypothetical protein BSKO_07124 [Bryopsis sp. KO-2023]